MIEEQEQANHEASRKLNIMFKGGGAATKQRNKSKGKMKKPAPKQPKRLKKKVDKKKKKKKLTPDQVKMIELRTLFKDR